MPGLPIGQGPLAPKKKKAPPTDKHGLVKPPIQLKTKPKPKPPKSVVVKPKVPPTKGGSNAGKRLNVEKKIKATRAQPASTRDAAARAVAAAGRQQKAKQAQEQRKREAIARHKGGTAKKASGTDLVRAEMARKKTAPPPAMSLANRVPFVEKKDITEASNAVLNMPGGFYDLGKALTLDIAKPKRGKHWYLPGSRTSAIVAGMAKGVARDLRHPLRNPPMTVLDLMMFGGAAGGAASRLGRGVSAGREAAAAGESATRAAVSAASKKPIPEPRTHYFEGQSIPGRYSIAPTSKAIQKAADKARMRKGAPLLAKKPAPGARLSTIGPRKAARLMSEKGRTEKALRSGPALKALAAAPKHGGTKEWLVEHPRTQHLVAKVARYRDVTTPQEMAIRVAAEGAPLDEVIQTHLAWAKAVEVKLKNLRNRGVPAGGTTKQLAMRLEKENQGLIRKASLLEESRKYLAENSAGEPIISVKYPDLQRRYEIAGAAASTRTARAGAAGKLSLQAAERRINAPGEMMTTRTRGGGRAIEVKEPRTLGQAKARLAKLEAVHDKVIGKLAQRLYHENPEDFKLVGGLSRRKKGSGYEVPGSQVERYKHGGQMNLGKMQGKERYVEERGPGFGAPKTAMQLAEARVVEKIMASKDPQAQAFKASLQEAANLRQAIQAHEEPAWLRPEQGGPPPPSLGTVTTWKGMSEAEPFIGGKYRVPDVLASKPPSMGGRSWRGGVPRPPGTLTHEYTGAARRSGDYTVQTTRAIGEDALDWENYAQVERTAKSVLPMGHDVRPVEPKGHYAETRTHHPQYVPVKERALNKAESKALRRALKEADTERLTPEEALAVDERVRKWQSDILPRNEDVITQVRDARTGEMIPITVNQVGPGTKIPGVKWVDRRLLGPYTGRLTGHWPVFDVVSDTYKGLMLYMKGGYALPNIGGNIVLNLVQQGPLAPANWARAMKMPDDLAFYFDEAMGEGFARSLAGGPQQTPVTYAVRKAGNFWNLFVDKPFRRASLYHELRRNGIKTEAQMRAFFENGGAREFEIVQRAKDAIIDYERMSPSEQAFVRRFLFIYPWVKGSTWYFAQMLRDHPVLSAVLTKMGQEGQATADRELGPRPEWAQGLFRIGGTNEKPLAINPQAISPFSTAPQVAGWVQSFGAPVESSQTVGEGLNPVLQAMISGAYQRNMFTGQKMDLGSLQGVGELLGQGLPQYQLYSRLTEGQTPAAQKRSTYPYTPTQAVGQFVVGSGFPRSVNRARLNAQASTAATDPIAKLAVEQKRYYAYVRGLDPSGFKRAKPYLDQAYARRVQVLEARKKAADEFGTGEPYIRAAYLAELEILAGNDPRIRDNLATFQKFARSAPLAEIKSARQSMASEFSVPKVPTP